MTNLKISEDSLCKQLKRTTLTQMHLLGPASVSAKGQTRGARIIQEWNLREEHQRKDRRFGGNKMRRGRMLKRQGARFHKMEKSKKGDLRKIPFR
jgi:hypothetical protein